ncbi:MAG: hypothetical protein WBA72_10180, partial [Ornithinimicrobium sp.]
VLLTIAPLVVTAAACSPSTAGLTDSTDLGTSAATGSGPTTTSTTTTPGTTSHAATGSPTTQAPTTGTPSTPPVPSETDACPGPVPEDLDVELDAFYDQYCDVFGVPVVADEDVDPAAVRRSADIMSRMLDHRPKIGRRMADFSIRVAIIGRDQQTTDMPEWSDLNEAFPETDWDTRTRGVGATFERPLVGAGEENLLCLPEDRYLGESIFVHELSHTIYDFGVTKVDGGFDARLSGAYDEAMAAGLWDGTYAATNPAEYWAEGAQSFYDTNLGAGPEHNGVDTREELRDYDPALYSLVAEVFGEDSWRPGCP